MDRFPKSGRLLQRVTWRMYAARVARRSFVWFVVLAVVYGAVLLVTRLTGLLPDVFSVESLWWAPAGGAALGLLTTRRPRLADAAHQADASLGTHDLFLTLTMLDRCVGDYKPLVGREAERRASAARADVVVPYAWRKPSLLGGVVAPAVVGLLALGVFFLPSLDPFAVQAQAKEQETLAQQLAEARKASETRRAQLQQQDDLDQDNSEEVEQALERLKFDLQQMRQKEKLENGQRLAANQKDLGDRWRRLNNEQLKHLMDGSNLDQQFGGPEAEQMRKWQRELQQGSSESLDQALEQLKEELKQLARIEDPIERSEALRKIEKQLREMSEFASNQAGSQPMAAALERALDQMEALRNAESKALEAEALSALQESLELSQMEAKELAQASRDMKSLEEALELISMAKRLNGEGMLDAEGMEPGQALADYAEMYAQMMSGMEGEGELGGEGFGEGGEAPEDDSVETDFVQEQSKSAVQKGKVLLSMKTKGLSDTGEAAQEYRAALQDVKQGVAEAIEQEQIPPGYREAIQQYFDTIETVESGLQTDPPQ